ncbi:MAG: ROK family transcriptional regulator [Negativicutes bacterium]|nr:ROK family transcriptional regulator [Negativicutes bacterium]
MAKTGNSKYLKLMNRMGVLNILRADEPLARSQLAELTGLTPPAITGIISELITIGFVEEIGRGKSHGGRKPVKLILNARAGYVIGIEITRKVSTVGVADLKNHPTSLTAHEIDMSDPEIGLPQLFTIVKGILASSEYAGERFLGLGLAFPGLLAMGAGVVKRAINLGPKWNGYPVKAVFEQALPLPVVVEMNPKVAVLAEKWFGDGQQHENLAYVNWGEGISAGIFQGNDLLQGCLGFAGQVGHVVLVENGPLCNCGNRGCTEAIWPFRL